jgi:hypothetical protein
VEDRAYDPTLPRVNRPNRRRRRSWATLINQIFDFESAEPDSLAGLEKTSDCALRLLAVEARLRRHEFGDCLSAAGYYNFRPMLDLVEKFAPLISCFERSNFSHNRSPTGPSP